jgi:hypothetical protein
VNGGEAPLIVGWEGRGGPSMVHYGAEWGIAFEDSLAEGSGVGN